MFGSTSTRERLPLLPRATSWSRACACARWGYPSGPSFPKGPAPAREFSGVGAGLGPLLARATRILESMAKRTVFVSDLSGAQIPDGKGAKIRITFNDARKGSAELDVTDEEAEELARKGRKVARRGRRPAATTG
jgi:hypothetical protein